MNHLLPLLVVLASTSPFSEVAGSNEPAWTRFRGPDGAGIAPDDAPLPSRLDPDGNLLWSCALPTGISSPVVIGDRVFVTSASDRQLSTHCIDRTTGELRWTRSVEAAALERMHDVNDAAAATPAVDAEHVVVAFGSFGLLVYDHDGEELWRRELPKKANTFGSAASPILVDGSIVFVRDTNEGSDLTRIEAATGEVVWRVERAGFGSGWSTPALRTVAGRRELLVYGVGWLTAYDFESGEERWAVPGLTDEPIVTPALDGELVFVTSYNMKTNLEVEGLPPFDELLAELDADGSGALSREEAEANDSVLSRADADGEGDHPLRIFFRWLDGDRDGQLTADEYRELLAWVDGFAHRNGLLAIRPEGAKGADGRPEIAWQEPRGVPECPSPLAYRGRVFLVKNGGLATCVEAATGKLLFSDRIGARGPWYASPVAGDGKIYTASARGEVSVLAAGDTLEVLSTTDLGERIQATPALLGGVVYVRTEGRLLAFGAE